MPNQFNPLQKQLDHQKFLHAIQYMRTESKSLKKLTTTELSRTNQFITGIEDDPWRYKPVQVKIPTGQIHQVNVHTNPITRAREILGNALQIAGNGDVLDSAHYLYSHLVLEHLFLQGNRRTAVAAVIWIFAHYGLDCDAEVLLKTPIGDLRKSKDLDQLKIHLSALTKNQPS